MDEKEKIFHDIRNRKKLTEKQINLIKKKNE
jgi:hypothetical protein